MEDITFPRQGSYVFLGTVTDPLELRNERQKAMNSIFDTPQYQARWAMYETALSAGIPIVSTETCAIICAMLLVWGNHEMFTHNHRLVCELRYAQRRFHVEGGETPDPEFAQTLRYYVGQLQLMQDREQRVPDHIDRLFQERYGFHFNHD